MKTIYAIKDRVAQEIVGNAMYQLFTFRTDQQATRYFADAIHDDKSMLNKHPDDYELIKIADIDDDGNITAEHGPSVVITGTILMGASTQLDG